MVSPMKDSNIRKLVLAALFAALCTIMTLVIQDPSQMQGYVNLGECAVLMAAWTLGPFSGGMAAAIGSMLADLLSGYAYYAPGTFVIKLAMAVSAALIFRFLQHRTASHLLVSQVISGVVAESIMVVGYFGYASLWLGKGLAAAASIPGNVVQGVFGLVAAAAVYAILNRSRVLSHI
ncbi:MAG: ECF transporter S component [Lawsonibacter sp.]|nr:ECF transporter S component [Lawsonibacter sp.]